MSELKQKLFDHCLEYIQGRIDIITEAIRSAQASANDDTKSSAGDKYETGRAMMQQEIDKNTIQLAESRRMKQVLEQIAVNNYLDKVHPGSIVITDNGSFYIGISAGQFVYKDQIFHTISGASPIGAKLIGMHTGEQIEFNSRKYKVLEII